MKTFGTFSAAFILCYVAYSIYNVIASFNGEYISTEENYISIAGVIICIILAVINSSLSRKKKK